MSDPPPTSRRGSAQPAPEVQSQATRPSIGGRIVGLFSDRADRRLLLGVGLIAGLVIALLVGFG